MANIFKYHKRYISIKKAQKIILLNTDYKESSSLISLDF